LTDDVIDSTVSINNGGGVHWVGKVTSPHLIPPAAEGCLGRSATLDQDAPGSDESAWMGFIGDPWKDKALDR
jgi:hypothetical protein